MKKSKTTLSVRQQKFVDGILKGLTQEDAYVSAGYKATGNRARAAASRLLTNVNILLTIKEGRKKDDADVEVTRDRLIKEYAKIAFCNATQLFDAEGKIRNIHEMDEDVKAAIVGIEIVETFLKDGAARTTTKFKLETKKGALDSLSKIKGLFIDRHKVEFDSGTLKAILDGLPESLAFEVKAALMALVKK